MRTHWPERETRVGVLCMHASPLAQAGIGDGGGLSVYVRELASALAHQGAACDVYVRRSSASTPPVVVTEPGVRVVTVDAGPFDAPKGRLARHSDEFARAVAEQFGATPPDVLHAHYWLSGLAGHRLKHEFEIPLAVTFHTLGRVKAAAGDVEPARRGDAEQTVVDCADAVFVSGRAEARQMRTHYDVSDERLRMLAPGVNTALFSPGPRAVARAELGLREMPTMLFVGRLQPLKRADVALETLVGLVPRQVQLVVVGGPSGPQGHATLGQLQHLVDRHGLRDRVHFVPPQPHRQLAVYYRAADVCLVPSRSESFGLVALEAAACGTPVVAADVGGLRDAVRDGVNGRLVAGRGIDGFVDAVGELLDDELLGLEWGEAGRVHARAHSWRAGAQAALRAYRSVSQRELVACA